MDSSQGVGVFEYHKKPNSKGKRLLWREEEIGLFLQLLKDKKDQGLLDGKRLRASEIFPSLVAPMKKAGFVKTAIQLQVKWKNLKSEYSACKRNNVNGQDLKFCQFFDELDELLGSKPLSLMQSFEAVNIPETITSDIIDGNICDVQLMVPTAELPIPGTSHSFNSEVRLGDDNSSSSSDTKQNEQFHSSSEENNKRIKENIRKYRYNKKPTSPSFEAFAKCLRETQNDFKNFLTDRQEKEQEFLTNLMSEFLTSQQKIMEACTSQFLFAINNIMRPYQFGHFVPQTNMPTFQPFVPTVATDSRNGHKLSKKKRHYDGENKNSSDKKDRKALFKAKDTSDSDSD